MIFIKGPELLTKWIFLVICCAHASLLTGCTSISRAPGNRPLWFTRLPDDRSFEGMVFFLDGVPKGEFAFLLAEYYPDSFIAVRPVEPGEWKSFYLGRESIQPHNVSRKPAHTLPPILVIHQFTMTPCDELPPLIEGSPMLHMTWSKEPFPDPWGPDHPVKKNLAAIFISAPAVTPLGLVWPPPIPVPSIARGPNRNTFQRLHVRTDSSDEIMLRARAKADRGITYGLLWDFLVPIILLQNDKSISPYFEESSDGRSPGGWADCLEQMFKQSEVLKAADSVTPQGIAKREAWFERSFKENGFFLEKVRVGKWDDDGTGIHLMRNASEPNTTRYKWMGLREGRNELVEVYGSESSKP